MPRVDVLVPTYCRPAGLAVTLAGLVGQSERDFRLVLSDQSDEHRSTDGAEANAVVQILRARGHEVEVHADRPRRGMAEQRHFLLDRAQARFALFLDDDVLLLPDALERLLAAGLVDRVIRQPVNRGKGAAIRAALAASTGNVVIVQDADLEYDPADWPALLEPIVDGRADAVFGSRFLGGSHRVLYYWHSVGNKLLTTVSNMFTNLNLTDMETCYKAMRGELARALLPKLTTDRFGFEPEITARLAQADARIYEVPISYSGRTYAEGKKINWKDGVAAFWHIVRFNVVRPK